MSVLIMIILLSISLSMDSLGIGISYGVRSIRISFFSKIVISIISMLFTGAAVLAGRVILLIIPEKIAQIIGIAMLFALGCYIILSSLIIKKEKKATKEGCKINLKPFGVTIKITRNPILSNFDKSKQVDMFEAMYLGIALSIDSFAAGLSSAVSGLNSYFIPLAVGIAQFVFLSMGILVGEKIASVSKIDAKIFIIISGALLIAMSGIRIYGIL